MTNLSFTMLAFLAVFAAQATELDPLFQGTASALRVPAAAPPEEFTKDFTVVGPERNPASAEKGKKAGKTSARRSRLPAAVANGLELRVQYNKLTSMFWVVQRGVHYDLVYANSSGSKSSIGLSIENFKAVYDIAQDFKSTEGDLSKCREASMQLHIVRTGHPERTVTMCVNEKGAAADKLRLFSQSLAAMVR